MIILGILGFELVCGLFSDGGFVGISQDIYAAE